MDPEQDRQDEDEVRANLEIFLGSRGAADDVMDGTITYGPDSD
jgi:hypothetical protein